MKIVPKIEKLNPQITKKNLYIKIDMTFVQKVTQNIINYSCHSVTKDTTVVQYKEGKQIECFNTF